VRITRRQLGEGVADTDDRTPIEEIGRKALVLHPGTMDEPVAILETEPVRGAKFRIGH
jgi:hypothetical protein